MGKEITKQHRAQELMRRMNGELKKVLPNWMTPERMGRMALTEFRNVPRLYDCTDASIAKTVMQCAELGLEPGSALKQAHMVPFGDECTLIIGYRGLLEMARRSGQIQDIYAEIVYANDYFKYELGLEPKLEHRPVMENRGNAVFGYAVCHLKDGGRQFEVMSVDEINAIRDKALAKIRNKKDTPWVNFWGQMARKTLLRRLCNYLPAAVLPVKVQEILATEDDRFFGDTTATLISSETKKATEGLRERLEETGQKESAPPAETEKEEPPEEAPAEEQSSESADLSKEKKSRKFAMTATRVNAIEEMAVKSGWQIEMFHRWILQTYKCGLKQLQTEAVYNEVQDMAQETPIE